MVNFVPLNNTTLKIKVDTNTAKELLEKEGRFDERLEVSENIWEGIWSVIKNVYIMQRLIV